MSTDSALKDVGQVTRAGDSQQLVFERRYNKPIEKVWAALTVPERLADWLADATIDLRQGGEIHLNWGKGANEMTGRVMVYQPPRSLAWTWEIAGRQTLVRFDLAPDGAGCLLTLTHSGLGLYNGQGGGVRAGWHAHLEAFEGAIDGRGTGWPAIMARVPALQKYYPALPDAPQA